MLATVPPSGKTDKPLIALVFEYPTKDDECFRRLLSGSTGQFFQNVLRHVGIDLEQCYLTSLLKHRPHNNDFGTLYHDKKRVNPTAELLTSRSNLNSELSKVQPSIVVAIGGESLRSFKDVVNPLGYRGTVVHASDCNLRVVPTYNPSYILRGNIQDLPILEADLRKALRIAQTETWNYPTTRFITDPSFQECLHYLNQQYDTIAYDYETVNNLTWLFGFAWSEQNAISIPFTRQQTHRWTTEQEIELTLALKRLLENPKITKIVQNGLYDNTISARELGINVQGVEIDTMLAQHTLYPELPKGLDFLSSIYTDHPMYWDNGRNAVYNCYDCVVTYSVAKQQKLELQQRNMWEFFQQIPMKLMPALCKVQSRGVLIDQELRLKLRATESAKLERLKTVTPTLGYSGNPLSPVKVMEHLYETLKLPKQYKGHGANKKLTSDDEALQALAKKAPTARPLVENLLDIRQTNVLISTFIDQELLNGRAVTSYNPAGTVTGRLTSSATIDGLGGNLQNIPRGDFRRIFTADPGCVLIKSDLSQAEYRVLIWKARVHRVIHRWTTDPSFNIHRWNASENIYRIPLGEVTEQQYSYAKNGVYGANYNVGPLKVSRLYNIPLREAKFILSRYHEAVPEIQGVYQREIQKALHSTRCLRNPLGRERYFGGTLNDDTYREAYSWYPQSTVGDLINSALVDLVDAEIDVLLQVHDELVCQCPVGRVAEVTTVIRKSMERAISIPGVDIPLVIPCDIKIGYNWHDTVSLTKWKETHG